MTYETPPHTPDTHSLPLMGITVVVTQEGPKTEEVNTCNVNTLISYCLKLHRFSLLGEEPVSSKSTSDAIASSAALASMASTAV